MSEPDWQDLWPREMTERNEYAQRLFDDFVRVRDMFLSGDAVPDRRNGDGSAISDYFPHAADRRRVRAYDVVPVRRNNLTPDFLLAMKHNAHYTCILDELVSLPGFVSLAVIHHPLPTILSWRSLALPIS